MKNIFETYYWSIIICLFQSGGTARTVLVCNDYGGWTEEEFEGAIDGRMPASREFVGKAKVGCMLDVA